MVTRMPLDEALGTLTAPSLPMLAWARGYDCAWSTALASCPQSDWLLWIYCELLNRGYVRREPLSIATCLCVRSMIRDRVVGDDCSMRVIDTVESWCVGRASHDEVRVIRREAWAYAHTVKDSYASSVAMAACSVADTADMGAWAYAIRSAASDAVGRCASHSVNVLSVLRRELSHHMILGLESHTTTLLHKVNQ
jgi:hypothetical protein